MKNRDIFWRRYKIQETLYMGQWCLRPLQSRHLGITHSSPIISFSVQNTLQNPLLELPSAAPLYFLESHWWSEISSLSKVILVWGKARTCRAWNLSFSGAESFGLLDVSPKNSSWDMMHERAHCPDEVVNHHLPTAVAIFVVLHLCTHCIVPESLLNHPNSFQRNVQA